MTDSILTAGKTQGEQDGGSPLRLVVPEQTPPPADCMLLEPRDTSQWIEALPLANIGETARQTYTTLLDFNRYEIPDLVRAKVVELFRPTVEYVCHNLRRHYMDIGFPLSKKAWKTVILARELNNELATAYKIIVERMLTDRAERFDRKVLVIALHHALHYLGRVYLHACLAYTSPPALLWKQVNAIFAFARQNQVHRIPVKMKHEQEDRISTIEETYQALLLFAAAVPSRLRQSHLEATYEKALEWASHTHFLGMDDDIPATGALNVNLGSDEGPIHNALRMPIAGRHIAVLDVRPLIRKLHDEYEQVPMDGGQPLQPPRNFVSRALLRQLIRNWHAPAERQFVRTRLHFSLHVLTGLKSIHAALSPEPEQPPARDDDILTSLSASPNVNVPAISEQRRVDPLSVIDDSRLSLAPSELNHHASQDSLLTDSQAAALPGEQWQESRMLDQLDPRGLEVTTINESAGGYCIPWSADAHPPKVKVGELLGIGGANDKPDYSLGVIRWLHSVSQSQLELGLEVISSHVQAMNALPVPNGHRQPIRKQGDSLPCLLLDLRDGRRENEEPSLVLSSATYPVGTQLWLDGLPEDLRLVRLTRLIDFSSGFARYGFEFANRREEEGAGGEDNIYDDFDSLWNAL